MNYIFALNLILNIFMVLSPIWWSTKLLKLDYANPLVITSLIYFPFEVMKILSVNWFIDGGILNKYFQFAILMNNIQLVTSILLVYVFNVSKYSNEFIEIIPKIGKFTRLDLMRLSILFFSMFLVAFFILGYSSGGVIEWIYNPRDSYMSKRDGNGIYYALAINFLSVSYLFFGLSLRSVPKFLVGSLVYLIVCSILGSKGFVLAFLLFSYFIVWLRSDFSTSKIPLIFISIIFVIIAILFFSNRSDIDFLEIVTYFDAYSNAANYYEDYFNGKIELFGGEVFLTSLFEYVPRFIYPDKPYVYGILKIVEIYFPGGAELGSTPAFNGGVFYFADFGLIGLLLTSLFNFSLAIYFLMTKFLLHDPHKLKDGNLDGRQLIVVLIVFSPMYGIFMPSLLYAIFTILIYLFINLVTHFFRNLNLRNIR